ncbi:LuxR C-terminal-related transcriptional regulator [Paenarthrobacter sp. NPDC057981]|uniref:helix-turn-helix transcriptional regulator n=1 Tax=Paenarthrobacter sp. NPDC057981 TaxID=3346297 RepID=UPI0036D7E402
MFDVEVQRVLDYIAHGIGVRIVGVPGSGKSTVVRNVVANLEKSGAMVHVIAGLRTHKNIPYSAIKTLGLDLRPGRSGVLDLADVLSSHLAVNGKHILVVDDIHFVDNESLAVLEAVRRRSSSPLIASAPETLSYSKGQLAVLNHGREAVLQLDPLHYEQVHTLISQVLGGPADADTTAQILTKAAGNPRLIVKIAETASLSDLLVRRGGLWRMTSETLWSDHLRGTIEALLAELTPEEFTGLNTMALLGTARIDVLQKIVHPDALDALERKGLLSVMEDHHNGPTAAVSPPVVADYFKGQKSLRDRHLLRSRIAGVLESTPAAVETFTTADCLSRVLTSLRQERSSDDAVTARHFHEHSTVRERTRFERWEADKSVTNAAALLRIYWGAPVDVKRAQRVCTETSTHDADPSDLLLFTISKALLAINAGRGLNAAVEVLNNLRKAHPGLKAGADAAILFISGSHGRVPSSRPEAGAGQVQGIGKLIQGLMHLYRLNPTSALEVIKDAKDDETFPHLRPFIHGFSLFAAGRIDESLVFALDWRAEARKNLDQFGVVTSSYIAVHGLLYRGYFEEAEYLMSSVFAMGRPGFVVDVLYDAMLRLAGLRHATSSAAPELSIVTQARTEVPDVGPLPGVGKGAYVLVAGSHADPVGFDRRALQLIKRQLKSGYVLEAMMTALLCTCLSPGRPVLDLLKKILRESNITVHQQFLAIATAVAEADHTVLGELLKNYEPDINLYQVGMLLQGGLKRQVLEGKADTAEFLVAASSQFAAGFPAAFDPLSFSAAKAMLLTERETEIAVLAGYRSNVEIAEQLGISARTVENHISNALRKTGATSRNRLFILARNSLPPE